jgi:hypothetical protein
VALEADVLLQDWPATNGWVPTNVLLNADVLLANNELVTTNVELTAFGLLSAGGLISTNITLVGHGFVSTNGLLTTNVVLTTNIVAKRREAITGLLKDRGMTLRNATCTDDDMARVLVDELERRGVKLVGNRDSVVLISEWDTAYGRALPLTFAAEVERRRRRLSTPAAMDERAVQIAQLLEVLPDLRNDAKSWPSNLLRFSYLRGVDGRLPGEGGPKPAASQSKSKGSEMGELDRPEGQSQLDYVPRLALEIRELDLDVRRKHKRGVRAIGVLGSDVYDKLLLLQSLHDLFPGVVFFTTDLDARLSHPSELEWSRNLIVASSFDMEADRETQNPTPPFRDTYQTAQYLACLEAVGYSPAEWLNRVEARLFEIGRRGPYVLDAHGSPIYPKRANGLPPFHAFVAAFLACILGLGLVLHFGPALRRWLAQAETLPRWQSRSLGWALGILLMLAIVLMSAMVWDHRQEWGEPFSILDGVSLWPAEIIRFIALVASCCLFGKALDEMKQSNHTLAQQFELPPLKPRRRFSLSLPARWRRLLQSYRRHPIIHRAGRERSVNARGLWRIYQCRGRFCHRLERSLPAAAGYWLIALCLIFILPIRFIPYRGWVSLSTDWLFSTLSFVLLVLLTFLVVDATLLCRWFIQTLSEQPTIWPEEVLKRESKARNMQPEDLREWLDVKCIAERTKTVGQLIYYPFLVLLVLIAARSSYFDQWDWPISVLLMYGIISMFAIYCASTMLRTAENARQAELAFLRGKLLVAKGNDDRKRVEQLRQTIEEIENVREGAFAPLTQQPVVRVLLLVPGGTGLLSLAEVLARSL